MMTVKDFVEKVAGVDEYVINGSNTWYCFRPADKNIAIVRYGDREIIDIIFSVDSYGEQYCEIYVK